MIPKTSSALKLLQRSRDEAHRFAINFHIDKRSKRTLQTELTNISGVGDKTAANLLKKFGSVKNIASVGLEELQEASGPKTGQLIFDYFNKTGKEK